MVIYKNQGAKTTELVPRIFKDRGGDEMSAEASTNESHNARPGKKMTYSYRKDRLG